jgi:hypothetical protein
MIQTFEAIEARDEKPWAEFYTMALFSRNGVQVAVKPTVASI